jgi:cytochrome P450
VWALFALAQDQRVRSELRDELLTVDTDNPTMDQLVALPYLDMVVRETMRLHPPVPVISKLAMKDDVLPLSAPIMDRKGRIHDTIRYVPAPTPLSVSSTQGNISNRVNKGSMILIPIAAINRDRSIWGGDADQFRYRTCSLEKVL